MKIDSEVVEMLPLVDENGNVIGKATRAECHSPLKLLHSVVHLHVVNKDGAILLQKRSKTKRIQPGKWDTAVGGHVDAGEDIATALVREAGEELGITDFEAVPVDRYIFESPVEKELIYSFATVTEFSADAFDYSTEEIDEVRFFTSHEIETLRDILIFTPNFLLEYDRISDKLNNLINNSFNERFDE